MKKPTAFFITGNSRSGTTMMAKILGNNSRVFTFNELHFFEQVWYPRKEVPEITSEEGINLFCQLISLQREGYLSERNPKEFFKEAKAFFDVDRGTVTPPFVFMNFLLYESKLHNKMIPCEQTPRNLFFINEISRFYPGSKIICMIRDPRDVLLSQKYKWKRRFLGHFDMPLKEVIRTWFNYHPITISKLWNSSAKKILDSLNKDNVHLVKFEELITNPEVVMEGLCNFLNIDFCESMLLIPAEGSSVENDCGKTGIDKTKTGKFMKGLTATEVYLCQKITSGLKSKFGYKDVRVKVNFLLLLGSFISFPVKLFFAFLLNLKRSKNLLNSIKRRFT